MPCRVQVRVLLGLVVLLVLVWAFTLVELGSVPPCWMPEDAL